MTFPQPAAPSHRNLIKKTLDYLKLETLQFVIGVFSLILIQPARFFRR
jgi:hypothetical protein